MPHIQDIRTTLKQILACVFPSVRLNSKRTFQYEIPCIFWGRNSRYSTFLMGLKYLHRYLFITILFSFIFPLLHPYQEQSLIQNSRVLTGRYLNVMKVVNYNEINLPIQSSHPFCHCILRGNLTLPKKRTFQVPCLLW